MSASKPHSIVLPAVIAEASATIREFSCPNWPHPGITGCEFCVRAEERGVFEALRKIKTEVEFQVGRSRGLFEQLEAAQHELAMERARGERQDMMHAGLKEEHDGLLEQLEAAQKVIDAATEYVFSSDGNAFGKFHDTLAEYATPNPATKTAPAAKVLAHDEPARGGGNQGGSGEPVPASERPS